MKSTGKYSHKPYKCAFEDCGHERSEGTNHWGAIYSPCPKCRWRKPPAFNAHRSVCLEACPEGTQLPQEWTLTTLGEITTDTGATQ